MHRIVRRALRQARPLALALTFAVAAPWAGSQILGCSSDASTSGKQVTLQTRAEVTASLTEGFTTGKGWQVKLSRAVLSVGPLYYFEGSPAVVRNEHRSPRERLAGLLGLGVAHAHPGHYTAGDALGQVLTGTTLDLFTAPKVLPSGNGITGAYRSASFSFTKPQGDAALGEAVALAEGVAERDGTSVYFHLEASLEDVSHNVPNGQVAGCVFDAAEVEDDGIVTLRIDPSVWFNWVDFELIEPGSADALTHVAVGSKPQIEFALGLSQLGAYHFSFSS